MLKEFQVLDKIKLCAGDIVEYRTVDSWTIYRGIVKGILSLSCDRTGIKIGRLPFYDDKNIIYDIITLNDIFFDKACIKILSK